MFLLTIGLMIMPLWLAIMMVYPSGEALATYSAARLDPAPGLLSTMMPWPSARVSGSLIARAMISAAPPGAKPTTRRIGLVGYVCAEAAHAVRKAISVKTTLMLEFLFKRATAFCGGSVSRP